MWRLARAVAACDPGDGAAKPGGPRVDDRRERAEPLVIDEPNAPQSEWDDPVRGRLRFRTLFSHGLTETAGMTCGVTELEAGGWLGLHRHAPREVYYVFAGAGIVSIEGREFPVKAKSAVFIPGIVEHGVRQTGHETLRLFYAFPVDTFASVEYLFTDAPSG
jgi:mannose-6-phosphate isomerase-like protein (cupin superfamily)